ncbi:MAG: DUF6364 family protein [Desulfonauticus sp.]|nr:DUF6364 family protein [Desulfonauticus sp.]
MNTKLTLRLDKDLIKKAKIYASKRDKSVSALVADFFSMLHVEEKTEIESIPPKVASLKGILKDQKITEKDYKKYLEEKYL